MQDRGLTPGVRVPPNPAGTLVRGCWVLACPAVWPWPRASPSKPVWWESAEVPMWLISPRETAEKTDSQSQTSGLSPGAGGRAYL
jgi:hypothetical protein